MVMSLLALSFFISHTVKAESNPFATEEVATIVTDHKGMKCGEGKCGEGKMKDAKKAKCGEGKCGEGKMKDKSQKCGS